MGGAYGMFVPGLLLVALTTPCSSYEVVKDVHIDYRKPLHETNTRFLSVAFGYSVFQSNFKVFDVDSPRIELLAKALSPSYVRIGGSWVDFMTFNPLDEVKTTRKPKGKRQLNDTTYFKNFILRGNQVLRMTKFLERVGWDIVLDLKLLSRKDDLWDSSNTELYLDFLAKHQVRISYFQLGNEVDSNAYAFGRGVSPSVLVHDIRTLRLLLHKYPIYRDTPILGPELTRPVKPSSQSYFHRFLQAAGCNVLDAISFHQYYFDAKNATPQHFISAANMDIFQGDVNVINKFKTDYKCCLPVWVTETATAWGGGVLGLSERFVAGFLWLDKLGIAAKSKVTTVNRQTFFGSNYGFLTRQKAEPTACYFLSVMFKHMVEGPVFQVNPSYAGLRLYAQCARRGWYQAGAMVVYYLNYVNRSAPISLSQYKNMPKIVYPFTSADGSLNSSQVKVNGHILVMENGSRVPNFMATMTKTDVDLPPLSYGFVAIPEANQFWCRRYFRTGTRGSSTAVRRNTCSPMLLYLSLIVVCRFDSRVMTTVSPCCFTFLQ